MDSSLRVLIVEDSEDDTASIVRELRQAGYEPAYDRVDTPQAFSAALAKQAWDAVIADYSLPRFDGLSALELLQGSGLDLPFVIVSGTTGEDVAVRVMKAGAHDYVLKENLARLGPAVRREMREAEGRRARRQAEAQLRRRTALLEALQQVGLELTAQLDLDTLLHSIVSRAIELLDGTSGGLYLYRPEQDVLEWSIGIGPALPPIGCVLQRGEGLCGKVWESGEPLIVNNYREWEGRAVIFDGLPNVATLGALVRWGDESLGVLNILADLSRPFSAADAELLSLFANQAAIAIRNARLYEAAQARSRYLETLQGINATLRSTLPLDEVLDTIVQGTGEVLGYVASLIAVLDAAGERLTLGAVWGGRLLDAMIKLTGLRLDAFGLPLSAGENPVARAYRSGEIQIWRHPPERILVGVEPQVNLKLAPVIQRAIGARLAACIPLPGIERLVGVLVVMSPKDRIPDEERMVLLGLADQAGLAIENAHLYEEARRRAERLAVVNHVARAVGATLHLDDLLETVYQQIASIFQADAFFIALYDEGADELDFHFQVDEGVRQAPERHPVANGLTSLVVSGKKPLLVRDLKREWDDLPEPVLWGTMKLAASWLGVPMRIGERLVGVICVQSYHPHAYDQEDQLLLSTIADQVAVAVEKAQLYQTLRESEERYRTLFEQANDAVFLETLDGRILDVNERACQLLGYNRQELLGLTVADLVPPGLRQMLPRLVERQLIEGGARIEAENVRKDGSRVAVEVSTALLEVGGQDLVLALVRDITERKLAEEALRESEVKHRLLLSSIWSPVLAVDNDMTILYCSEAYAEFVGKSTVELEGKSLLALFPEFEETQFSAAYLQVLETGEVCRVEGQIQDHYLRSWVYPTPWGILAINEDISEQKRAEREIAERQQYLEGVLAAAPDAIVTLDDQHRIVEWNPGAERLFGYAREEAIGYNIDRLITNADVLEEAEGLTGVILRGEPVLPREVVRYRKDGSPVHVIAAGSPILAEGKLIGVVAVYTDISRRKRAERLLQALNEAALAVQQALTPEEAFATVGEEFKTLGFSCAIFLMDDEKSRLIPKYLNYDSEAIAAAEKLMGMKAEEFFIPIDSAKILGQAVWEGRTVSAQAEDTLRQVLPGPLKRFAGQLVRILNIGKSVEVPLIVEDEVRGLLSVQSDDLTEEDIPAITAFAHQVAAAWRKAQLLQDLEASLEELKQTHAQFLQAQKMEAVGRLAGGLAHDLNNMLTVIQFGTQLIQRQLHPADPLWEHLWQIEEAGERATRLTKQLLIFSRREVVEPRVIDLSQVVGDLSQMLRRIIGEDIELVTFLASDLWPVKADPSQIEQVVVNLVVNARDAMPQGGQLVIETTNVVLDEMYTARHLDVQPGDYVMLAVSDTGVGMPDEIKEHLFEPFFTTKERGKGTGLGLATVFGIVKQHRGHIWVYSEVGLGTTFKVYLPHAEKSESPHDSPPFGTPSSALRGSETILVVEDERHVRELTVRILEAHGYRVLTAGNGLEALRLSAGHDGPIDLLLTDVVMPLMNGKELTRRLQAERPNIQVLFISGYSDDLIAHHGVLEEGVVLLSKPFTMEALVRKVRLLLDATT